MYNCYKNDPNWNKKKRYYQKKNYKKIQKIPILHLRYRSDGLRKT